MKTHLLSAAPFCAFSFLPRSHTLAYTSRTSPTLCVSPGTAQIFMHLTLCSNLPWRDAHIKAVQSTAFLSIHIDFHVMQQLINNVITLILDSPQNKAVCDNDDFWHSLLLIREQTNLHLAYLLPECCDDFIQRPLPEALCKNTLHGGTRSATFECYQSTRPT